MEGPLSAKEIQQLIEMDIPSGSDMSSEDEDFDEGNVVLLSQVPDSKTVDLAFATCPSTPDQFEWPTAEIFTPTQKVKSVSS